MVNGKNFPPTFNLAKWHARIKEAKDAASKSQDRALLDDLKPEEQNGNKK